ncbi:uncharacterized protein LOC127839538 [Dreissena polymorpha]|uniref:uncharacterized protein LOC127839538 n=1 Tax=Dreissena polymorpha TaxID=45954 RepID=UPI0022648329|nr:uncharacterized protein LOC127839538 [Dreissena polymorpha]
MYGIVVFATSLCLIACALNVQLSVNVPSADVQLSCYWEGDTKVVAFLRKNKISDKFRTEFEVMYKTYKCTVRQPYAYNVQCKCVIDGSVHCNLIDLSVGLDDSQWRCAIAAEGTFNHSNDVTIRANAISVSTFSSADSCQCKPDYGLADSNEKTTCPAIVVTLACGNIILGASILVLLFKTHLTVCLRRAFGNETDSSANRQEASVIENNAASAIEDTYLTVNDNETTMVETFCT